MIPTIRSTTPTTTWRSSPATTGRASSSRSPTTSRDGTDALDRPQTALENWSNANNVFQFVRVEDIAYDPDNPRVVYFADTGSTRLKEEPSDRPPGPRR